SELERAPRDLPREPLERAVEHVALGESLSDPLGGVHHERMRLAQRQQAEGVVEVTVGEDDRVDGGMPGAARMESGEAFDLLADPRRDVQQDPALAVRADGHAFLGPRRRADRACANTATVRTAAVPLGKAAASRRA